MPKMKWNQYSYKNLDEQRQDKENQHMRDRNRLLSRIGLGLVAVAIALLKNVPDGFYASVAEFLPVLGLFLAIAFPIIIGAVFFSIARRKFKQENLYAEEVPEFPNRYRRPIKPETRDSAAQAARPQPSAEQHTANTASVRDYSESTDSWDIKDPKPPWEL